MIEGNEVRSLLLLCSMNAVAQIKALEHNVEALISGKPGFFLVEIKISPSHDIKVFIDADQGVSIDELVWCNRSLYKQIEESDLFPGGDFSLEVSSPGLDEPLKLHRQYLKNIGKEVEVICRDGVKTVGILLIVRETELVLQEEKGKGKKREFAEHTIQFENIKSTKVQIKF
jgi:ribosome maturation factor RimP